MKPGNRGEQRCQVQQGNLEDEAICLMRQGLSFRGKALCVASGLNRGRRKHRFLSTRSYLEKPDSKDDYRLERRSLNYQSGGFI